MPRFSIVIPCFNAENTIRQTLNSLCAQTFDGFEIICVDDGSSDKTRDIVLAAQDEDPRISLACNVGKGPSDARNFGAFTLAKVDIIAFCDADDLWAPSKLNYLEAAFKFTHTDAAYSKTAFFQDCPDYATTVSDVPRGDLTVRHLLGENPVCTMSNVAVRKQVFEATGGFDPNIVQNEDLEWLIRLVAQGARVVSIEETLTYYRRSLGGLSTDLPAMLRGREAALRTAARFGFGPDKQDEAIFMRYLARRALRIGLSRIEAARFALRGVFNSPIGFFSTPRRGVLTLCGALAAIILPRRLSLKLFAH